MRAPEIRLVDASGVNQVNFVAAELGVRDADWTLCRCAAAEAIVKGLDDSGTTRLALTRMTMRSSSTFLLLALAACQQDRPREHAGARTNAEQEREATPQEVARAAMPAVVVLTMRDVNAQPFALGSGFFVADGVVATNAHVVEGATSGSAKSLRDQQSLSVEGVLAVDQTHDVALLSVHPSRDAIPISARDSHEVGESIFAVGNPEGLEGTFSTGVLSAVRVLGTDTVLQITAPISHGSSGGPVLNVKGAVIGIATAAFRDGQNLNFAIPAKWIDSLLSERSALQPLSTVRRKGRDSGRPWSGQGTPALVGENFQWEGEFDFQSGYTFSLRNKSNDAITAVTCLVIFYDDRGKPIEADPVQFSGIVPAGLAQRVSSKVDASVKRLTTRHESIAPVYSYRPYTKVEYRILSYETAR